MTDPTQDRLANLLEEKDMDCNYCSMCGAHDTHKFTHKNGLCLCWKCAGPHMFTLVRNEDLTGISGTGIVAEGIEFTDGTVVLRWLSNYASTVVWDSLKLAMNVHGHGGKTVVKWLEE